MVVIIIIFSMLIFCTDSYICTYLNLHDPVNQFKTVPFANLSSKVNFIMTVNISQVQIIFTSNNGSQCHGIYSKSNLKLFLFHLLGS